jgi:ATP-dependent RNA helicase RhlE
VHRIGRTGRAGGVGHAISFATPDQKSDVRDIERLMRGTLPLSRLPELPPSRMSAANVHSRPLPPRRPFAHSPAPPSHKPGRRFGGSRSFQKRSRFRWGR